MADSQPQLTTLMPLSININCPLGLETLKGVAALGNRNGPPGRETKNNAIAHCNSPTVHSWGGHTPPDPPTVKQKTI